MLQLHIPILFLYKLLAVNVSIYIVYYGQSYLDLALVFQYKYIMIQHPWWSSFTTNYQLNP